MQIDAAQVMAGSTVILVILTGYYAFQTRRTAEIMSEQFNGKAFDITRKYSAALFGNGWTISQE